MKITAVEPFILHVPLTASSISDSTHSITHWGVVGREDRHRRRARRLRLHRHPCPLAVGPADHLLHPRLLRAAAYRRGRRSTRTRLWMKLARNPALQWVGRAGITQLALAAVDVALWDLGAKAGRRAALGVPRRRHLADGSRPTTPTSAGCRSRTTSSSTAARRAVEDDGYRRHQAQGRPRRHRHRSRPAGGGARGGGPGRDDRHRRQRQVGPADLPALLPPRRGRSTSFWFEEPLWYDDVAGHAALARATTIPVALGEQLYIARRLQRVHRRRRDPLRPARRDPARRHHRIHHGRRDRARSRRLPVVPHVGEMGQVHVHLAILAPGDDDARIHPVDQGLLSSSRSRSRTGLSCGPSSRAPARRRRQEAIDAFTVPLS